MGGGVEGWCCGGSWAGIVEESWAESEALSNVRVQGQDCRVSTCSPLGPTARAIINPLSGATACHYSLTCTHTHWNMHVFTHTNTLNMNPLIHRTVWCVMYSYRQTDVNTEKRRNASITMLLSSIWKPCITSSIKYVDT